MSYRWIRQCWPLAAALVLLASLAVPGVRAATPATAESHSGMLPGSDADSVVSQARAWVVWALLGVDPTHQYQLSSQHHALPAVAAQGTFLTPVAGQELVEPPVRASVNGVLDTTLTPRFTQTTAVGQSVTTAVYEQLYPSPTLRFRPGDTVRVRLPNQLPTGLPSPALQGPALARDNSTNLHVHGLHVSPSNNSDNVFVQIHPTETFLYEYQIPTNHPGGLYWYHPHFHGLTSPQLADGMAGAIVIDGELDRLPGIAGLRERVLVLHTTQFFADGQVVPFFLRLPPGPNDNVLRTVNGQYKPIIRIRSGETQRWRIANVSMGDFMNVRLDGHDLNVIETDGNPLNQVVTQSEFLLGPSSRVEALIRGGAPGTYVLRQRALQIAPGVVEPDLELATVIVEGPAAPPQPLPTQLVPFVDLRNVPVNRQRTITFSNGSGGTFLIDGQTFDENRIDQTVQLGATEEWTIRNAADEDHTFHIHVNPFQVISVNGTPVDAHGYNDNVVLPPSSTTVMRTRFLDFTGKFVFHCHILLHEDLGMMATVQVVAAATPTATPTSTRTPTRTLTPTATPPSISLAQAVALVSANGPTGTAGQPAASTAGDVATVTGGVNGSGRATTGMSWQLVATVPPGVAAGTVPVAVFSTTNGFEAFACSPVVLGISTVACNGSTLGNALQGSTVTVVFSPGVTSTGTVTGPGPRPTATPPVPAPPLLIAPPPPIVVPPPPPPLPPPPLPILPPVAPFLAPGAPAMAAVPAPSSPFAEVPVIPEADSLWLLLGGCLALIAARRWRAR